MCLLDRRETTLSVSCPQGRLGMVRDFMEVLGRSLVSTALRRKRTWLQAGFGVSSRTPWLRARAWARHSKEDSVQPLEDSAPPRPRSPEAPRRRAVAAMAEAVAEQGYAATTVEDIL